MNNKLYLIVMGLVLMINIISAQNLHRAIAVLDLTERNEDSNDARLFSVEHMVKVTGIPYVITDNVDEAMNYGMIMCSSLLKNTTFTTDEKAAIIGYVENGGNLFAPRIEDEDFFALFGIAAYESNWSRYEIHWDSTQAVEAFRWIDEPEEWTVSLGRSTYDKIYKTLGYLPTTAKTLARYSDGTAAVTMNAYGQGQALSIGLSWKEVILRNQINRDYEAQRISSNGFEPTSDVFSLFIRGLFAQFHPFTVWKHTSPGNSTSTLMITHDIDSRTGMDTLVSFVDYEAAHGIEATYNVTVRYFDDALMSAFYLNRQSTMAYIKSHGQAFGSHSVGHFFDFADETLFPMGAPGNTIANYHPYNDGQATTGATIYGECEVSKNTLEEDIDINIRTFRAGHLAFPKYLVDVLDELGYEYNSTSSASDVLTNFPYQNKKGRSFSGAHSNVYEIPITISDVFHSDPISNQNYLDKANTWLDLSLKNRANGASTVLLIHPNRQYKLDGMSFYLDQLPKDIHIMEMGLFGDFWRARETFEFESQLTGDDLTIVIPANTDLTDNISLIVNNGQSLASIVAMDDQGQQLNFSQENWEDNDVILFFQDILSSNATIPPKEDIALKVFPNPTKHSLNIKFNLPTKSTVQVDLFDIYGKKTMNLFDKKNTLGHQQCQIDISTLGIPSGIYFIVLQTATGFKSRVKLMIL